MSETLELNPFGEFETIAEIAAFVHRKLGADAVRQALEASDRTTRESLEATADELEQVGLPKVAAIVLEVAADAPSELDLCPYHPDSHNGRSWIASRTRRRR